MVSNKNTRIFLLFFLILTGLAPNFAQIDSDQDLVPDEQELIDGTDPHDPTNNALFLKIRGNVAVGETITLSIEHPELGSFPFINFTIRNKAKTMHLTSDSSGELSFKIEESGVHYITAEKKNFRLESHFIPECGFEEKTFGFLPLLLLFLNHFANFLALIVFFSLFTLFFQLYISNSRTASHVFAGIFSGTIAFLNIVFIFSQHSTLIQFILLAQLFIGVTMLWLLKTKGTPIQLAKPASNLTLNTVKKFTLTPLYLKLAVLRIQEKILSKKLEIASKQTLKKAVNLKTQFKKSKMEELIPDPESLKKISDAERELRTNQKKLKALHLHLEKALMLKASLPADKEHQGARFAEKELDSLIKDLRRQEKSLIKKLRKTTEFVKATPNTPLPKTDALSLQKKTIEEQAQKFQGVEEAQKHLQKTRKKIENLHSHLQKALALKASVQKPDKKSIDELRAEAELDLVLEDLSAQIATELSISDLPEITKPMKAKVSKLSKAFKKLKRGKQTAEANACISLKDEFNIPLDASKAAFFSGSKKITPLQTTAEKVFFYFRESFAEIYVRVPGFVDTLCMVETDSSKKESELKLSTTLALKVTDEIGNALKDAFVSISFSQVKKVTDIYNNNIWKTPYPRQADNGWAKIPLNPAELKADLLKIKVVCAGFETQEILIPAQRISTEKQFTKIISLKKLPAGK